MLQVKSDCLCACTNPYESSSSMDDWSTYRQHLIGYGLNYLSVTLGINHTFTVFTVTLNIFNNCTLIAESTLKTCMLTVIKLDI